MAAMPKPVSAPDESFHLLTIAEYVELGEFEHGYSELIEGRLLMSPSPVANCSSICALWYRATSG